MAPFILPFTASMPAEWAPHTACLILYPHNPNTFRLACKPACKQVLDVAKAIAKEGNEDVVLFCKTQEEAQELSQQRLGSNIFIAVCPSDDTWARDTGPTFVVTSEGNLVGLDWDFNAYGGRESGCYWPCENDKMVASSMCFFLRNHYKMPLLQTHKIPLILEGGSIHTDGEGTVLTTRECLINENRNPILNKTEIETTVLEALGCTKMIWLPQGLAGDVDTNGHVDNMACFTKPGHVILSWTDDDETDSDNYNRCRAALTVLESERDAQGRKLVVHKLYLPPPMFYTEEEIKTLPPNAGRTVGERLAASYVNFYFANDAVIVPQFDQEIWDRKAVATLQELFPDRKVVGVPSREILLGGGNIHCITQQMPKV